MVGDPLAGPVLDADGFGAVDLADGHGVATDDDGEAGGFVELPGEFHEVGVGHGLEVDDGVGRAAHLTDPAADPVGAVVVALDGVCLLEGGEQPRHRAGRQLDAIGEFDEAPGSPADLVEERECAFDALHGLHRHTEYRHAGICQ